VEFYLSNADDGTLARVWQLGSARLGSAIEPHAYVLHDDDAVRHLFGVAAGLDSMVLGESQIQGQVRTALQESQEHAGPLLTRLFQHALQAGGRVRSETSLSAGAASIPSASVDLARSLLGDLRGRHALVLGTGEMAELALACLAKEGVRTTVAAYRNRERGKALADRFGGKTVPFDVAWKLVASDVDLMICATAAPHPVVTAAGLAGPLAQRSGRALCVLDIAVPRDVLPDVRELEHVTLHDVDDLEAVVDAGVKARLRHVPAAERIVQREAALFWDWYRSRETVEIIKALRRRLNAARDAELQGTLQNLDHLPPEDTERIVHLSRALMNKFLHEPTVRLRSAAGNGNARQLSDAIAYLFDLETPHPAGGNDDA
jgi:glutamyl-tRNA reductase